MYIHLHWSYHHPYAARTWGLPDWRSYLTGLRSLGYDFIQIWPMLDSMPPEPTASDLAFLGKLGQVIRMAQAEMGMKVALVSCPNTTGLPSDGQGCRGLLMDRASGADQHWGPMGASRCRCQRNARRVWYHYRGKASFGLAA